MDNDIKKARVDGKIIDVVPFESFVKNRPLYPQNYTGVTFQNNTEYVYPVRGKNDFRPGVYYYNSSISKVIQPVSEEDKQNYSYNNNVIDFSNADNIAEMMKKQNELRTMERVILTTPDNIFSPPIKDTDSPELVGLKTAVIAKHIDLDKYEQRFGKNYNNDKRLFNKDSITLDKMVRIMNNLDMKGTLIIEDANPDVPNPMGTKVTIELTQNNVWSEEDGPSSDNC
jgi:hypothetical protein